MLTVTKTVYKTMLACIGSSSFAATPSSYKAATKSNQNIKIYGIENVAHTKKIKSGPMEGALDHVTPLPLSMAPSATADSHHAHTCSLTNNR
jgi:hypothetical protein